MIVPGAGVGRTKKPKVVRHPPTRGCTAYRENRADMQQGGEQGLGRKGSGRGGCVSPSTSLRQRRSSPHCRKLGAALVRLVVGEPLHPRRPSGPMGSIARSHHMAGDARSCLELRGVFLYGMNSTLPEIPLRNTPQARRHIIKFIVILLRSR